MWLVGLQFVIVVFPGHTHILFVFQFETISKNMKLKEDYKRLQFLLSDESLTLLPEYQQRIQVRVNF